MCTEVTDSPLSPSPPPPSSPPSPLHLPPFPLSFTLSPSHSSPSPPFPLSPLLLPSFPLLLLQYDTDFYILDKYPLAVRPFYTMPDPNDTVCLPTTCNSIFTPCAPYILWPAFMRSSHLIHHVHTRHRYVWWEINCAPLHTIPYKAIYMCNDWCSTSLMHACIALI